MYRLKVSELAHQDLDKIVSYIAIQLANPRVAGDSLDEVDKCYWSFKEQSFDVCKMPRYEVGKRGLS